MNPDVKRLIDALDNMDNVKFSDLLNPEQKIQMVTLIASTGNIKDALGAIEKLVDPMLDQMAKFRNDNYGIFLTTLIAILRYELADLSGEPTDAEARVDWMKKFRGKSDSWI